MIKRILSLFLLIPSFGIAQQQINKTMSYDGISREYIVYIPASYDGSKAYPLLFSFHGGSGSSSGFINTNDMRPVADTAAFIAIYPQGAIDYDAVEPGIDPSTSWIHKAPTDHDDINFIAAIIDTLANEYVVDENRVYACGYSEGAIFSYELGCRLNHKIAAFAAVSGSMLSDYYRTDIYEWDACSPTHPTAMMLIPGTIDENPHSNYDGFSYLDSPLYLSADAITTFWSNYNNTDLTPSITNLDDSFANDNSTVEKKVWENGDNCTAVQELKVTGGDHDWPGSFGNMDISATNEIWNFVSRFDLNGLIDCNTASNHEMNTLENRKKIIRITDLLGRNTKEIKNTPLFYLYDDGTVEKKIIVE